METASNHTSVNQEAAPVPGVESDRVPLSVLDLAPVPAGSTPAEALAHSVELIQLAERTGYVRHWVAEHHNMPGIASSSPC